jgi:hypothetical protein
MIWLITSVLCFFLFKRFISKLETKDYGEWKPIKFPLWIWSLIVFACLAPIINFIALICVEIFIVGCTRDDYTILRFKKGKSHWINKLIDIMSKEY